MSSRLLDVLVAGRNALRPVAGRKTIFLHIGAHKTGTTAIQSLLRAESKRLQWFGFYYDRRVYRLAKILAVGSPLPGPERERLRRQVAARLNARREPNVIASAESLFGDLFASYVNIQAVAEDIRAILDGHDVRVVACIRRQDDFLQSVYHQHVKRGGTLRFDAFLRTHDVEAYRWNELLDKYVGVFGREAVSVFSYEDVFRAPTSILERLFPPLAASGFRSRTRPALSNPSLSRQGIEIAIRCNDLLNTQEQRTLRRFLQRAFPQPPGEKHALFSDDQRRELLEYYAASNRQCVDEFGMDPDAAAYFLGSGRPATTKSGV